LDFFYDNIPRKNR